MLSGKKENEGPFLLNPLWWELFWWTGKVVSVHPRLKTWKKSCLLILPPKPHGPPENSVVFPNETTDCLELSINKDFSVLFYNRGKSWENKYILKITRLYAYSVCMCVCVCDVIQCIKVCKGFYDSGNIRQHSLNVYYLLVWILLCLLTRCFENCCWCAFPEEKKKIGFDPI